MIYLDTHVVIWLWAGETGLLSAEASKWIELEDCVISPIVCLELQYLYELKRIKVSSTRITRDLDSEIGLRIDQLPFSQVIHHSLAQTWTRDPFDRIIVGQAKAKNNILLTKDRIIADHYAKAIW